MGAIFTLPREFYFQETSGYFLLVENQGKSLMLQKSKF